jgi:hypothetical protein
MKKVLIFLTLIASLLLAENINLDNSKIIDEIGVAGVYPKLKRLDPHAAGIWFLRGFYPAKWERVRNDEFELNDAINQAYNALKDYSKEKYHQYINKSGTLNLRIRFGKYNFKGHYFPLKDLMTKDSYVKFYGDRLIYHGDLFFENPGLAETKLYMKPSDAKIFLQSRKNSYGDVDRRLIAKYYYKIKKIDTDEKSINDNTVGYHDKPITKIIGHIYKIEIIDQKTNKVLRTINKK